MNSLVSSSTPFEELLNARGLEGWELVQTFFGEDGVVAVWKQEKNKKA